MFSSPVSRACAIRITLTVSRLLDLCYMQRSHPMSVGVLIQDVKVEAAAAHTKKDLNFRLLRPAEDKINCLCQCGGKYEGTNSSFTGWKVTQGRPNCLSHVSPYTNYLIHKSFTAFHNSDLPGSIPRQTAWIKKKWYEMPWRREGSAELLNVNMSINKYQSAD